MPRDDGSPEDRARGAQFRDSEPRGAQYPATEYRSTVGRVLTVAICGSCAIGLGALGLDQGVAEAAGYGSWLILVGVITWALFWNPRVLVDDSGVVLVNVFRTVRLPWPAIRDINTRWSLTLDTAYGTFQAWAAPAPGRHTGRDISPRELNAARDRPDGTHSNIRLGDSPRSPSGQAAMSIRRHWEALRDAGHLDDPRLEFDRPPVHWHLGTLAVVATLIAMGMVGLAF